MVDKAAILACFQVFLAEDALEDCLDQAVIPIKLVFKSNTESSRQRAQIVIKQTKVLQLASSE